MHLTQTLEYCFDELAIFTSPSSESDQRHALKKINFELNSIKTNAENKKIIVQIGDHIRQFRRKEISPEICHTKINLELAELADKMERLE